VQNNMHFEVWNYSWTSVIKGGCEFVPKIVIRIEQKLYNNYVNISVSTHGNMSSG